MCVVSIIAAVIAVSCPQSMAATEAAHILASSPGLSNRTNVFPIPDHSRVVFGPNMPASTSKPITQRRLDGTPLSQPPQVYGIPYPWTPLTWAILHSGGTRSR